jgi:hypothetical protein
MDMIYCRPKSLPEQRGPSGRRSAPADAKYETTIVRRVSANGRRGGSQRRIVVVNRYRWPAKGVKLSVQFLDNPSPTLRRMLLSHMNAWNKTANVTFAETNSTGQVRVARYDHPVDVSGYWSYLGTQILRIRPDEPTMNLEAFSEKHPESEFKRVVRHEAGHTLGFDHEHMRSEIVNMIDPQKAYEYFRRTDGWDKDDVDAQVLTPINQRSVMGTIESDPTSIMCYHLPGAIMKNGKPIAGGEDINSVDAKFCGTLYPKRSGRR